MATRSIRTVAVALLALAGSLSAAHAGGLDPQLSPSMSVWNSVLHAKGLTSRARPIFAAQQVYGQRCVTQVGWCPIDPQPVGSPCRCGDVEGTTLQ